MCVLSGNTPLCLEISGGTKKEELLTLIDIALQVLDNVIMTRWKVLPRDQCQGKNYNNIVILPPAHTNIIHHRYPQFYCEIYSREFRIRRENPSGAPSTEQAQSRSRLHSEARMAAQLAHLHQRDHLFLSCQPFDL